tara:strand:- start:7429 stop:8400 length:972 start_codon:yes stop_codon:yes gene_type:complete
MPLSFLIPAGLNIIGGMMQGDSNKSAANTQAAAQTEAARIAADAARFRPVGVTTAFGKSNFGTDAAGNLTSAGYTLSPEMAAQRDAFLGNAGGTGMNWAAQGGAAGQGLFDLGKGYLATSPERAAQEWMQKRKELLQPGQDQTYAKMNQNLFNTGRTGLSVAQGGGLDASNPEMQAYYNALQQRDLQLASDATAEGRAQTQFGQGLLTSGIDLTSKAYDPYKTMFGLGQSIETAGQGALDIGSSLGGRAATAGANVGQTLYQGGLASANTMATANKANPWADAISGAAQNPQLMSGVKNLFSPTQPVTAYEDMGPAAFGRWNQ